MLLLNYTIKANMLNKNKPAGFVKKIIIIIIAVVVLAIVSFVGKQKGYFSSFYDSLSQEEILAKQMEELESLKQANNADLLTQEETRKQSKELEGLRQKKSSLTQEDMNKQVEDLDALKANNQ